MSSVRWPHVLMKRVGPDHTASSFLDPSGSRSFLDEVIICKFQALASYCGRRTTCFSNQVPEYDFGRSLSNSIMPSSSVECWTLELVEIKQATLQRVAGHDQPWGIVMKSTQ